MTVHPARLALADHQPIYVAPSTGATGPIRCCCRRWTGPWCDFPEHQTEVLDVAGLLADVTPPETPTARVLAEMDPWAYLGERVGEIQARRAETPTARVVAAITDDQPPDPNRARATLGPPIRLVCGRCGAVAVPDGSTPIGLPQDWERFIVKGEARYACPACIEAAT